MAAMTERQKRFCDEYLISLNATQAAIKAGYSEKYAGQNADKLLKNTNVSEYLRARMDDKESELIATQDEVLKYLTSVLRGESKSAVLARQFDGSEEVIKKAPDEKERLNAAQQLGKYYGIYSEKVDIKGAVPVVISGADQLED